MMKLLITTGQGPIECEIFLKKAVPVFLKEAARRGIKAVMETQTKGSCEVRLSAPMPDWVGSWEWCSRSPVRPRHKRSRWFIEAKVMGAQVDVPDVPVHEVVYQPITAGGPGGQHQNKTQSAVRAKWTAPDGVVFQLVVRQERSQHRNRALAYTLLCEQVAVHYEGLQSAVSTQLHRDRKGIARGGAVQSFKKL